MRKQILASGLGFLAIVLVTFLLARGVWSQQRPSQVAAASPAARPEQAAQRIPSQVVIDPKVLVEQLEARVAALEKVGPRVAALENRVAKLEAYKAKLATHEHAYIAGQLGRRHTDGPSPGIGRGEGLGD